MTEQQNKDRLIVEILGDLVQVNFNGKVISEGEVDRKEYHTCGEIFRLDLTLYPRSLFDD